MKLTTPMVKLLRYSGKQHHKDDGYIRMGNARYVRTLLALERRGLVVITQGKPRMTGLYVFRLTEAGLKLLYEMNNTKLGGDQSDPRS